MKTNQNDKLRKEKTTVYVSKDCLKKCDSSLVLTGVKSRSEFLNKQLTFIVGTLYQKTIKIF